MSLPDKPRFSSPCNNCGRCCREQICFAGKLAFPGAVAPCPGIVLEGDKSLCALVKTEKENNLPPILEIGLGIGNGCSMPDDRTTDAEVELFTHISTLRANAQWEAVRNAHIKNNLAPK
jgi:hypothetical protein